MGSRHSIPPLQCTGAVPSTRMKLLAASARMWLLLLLVAPGYSTYYPATKTFDAATATIMELKHFCSRCASAYQAGQYSIDRNAYCQWAVGCKVTTDNYVFVAPIQEGSWRRDYYGNIWSQAKFDTYQCSSVPNNGNGNNPNCWWRGRCYAGPFNYKGHLDYKKL